MVLAALRFDGVLGDLGESGARWRGCGPGRGFPALLQDVGLVL